MIALKIKVYMRIEYFIKLFVFLVFGLFFVLVLMSCSSKYVPVHITCPPDPLMRVVKVQNNSITGVSLDNVIDNHISLWEYIHEVQKLGCTSK